MEIVLRTKTPEGIEVILTALAGLWVLAVVEFGEVPATIVTVFFADHRPS